MLLLSGRQALGQIANQESCLPNSFLILSPPRCSSSPVSLWFILCSSDLFLESVSVSSSCHNSASSLLFPIWTDFFCFNHACYTSRRNLKYSKENSKKRSQGNAISSLNDIRVNVSLGHNPKEQFDVYMQTMYFNPHFTPYATINSQ